MCNSFTYLGIVFTTRLSWTKHVDSIISKCQSKIGVLYSKLRLKEMPISVLFDAFNTYILPVITYGIPIWLPNLCKSAEKKLNSLYTKYLKRYLGVPYSLYNSIVHFLTSSCPLTEILKSKLLKSALKINYPRVFEGTVIDLPDDYLSNYNPVSKIPSWFWMSVPIHDHLPINPDARRALLYSVLDLVHPHICKRSDFHIHPDENYCRCSYCSEPADRFHARNCLLLSRLSPSALLREVTS